MPIYEFNLRPSRIYFFIAEAFLFASILIVSFLSIHFLLKLSVFLAVFLSAKIVWSQVLRENHSEILGFRFIGDKACLLQTNVGIKRGILQGDSYASPFCMVLRFKGIGSRKWTSAWRDYRCVILPDSLTNHEYRLLLSLLKLGA